MNDFILALGDGAEAGQTAFWDSSAGGILQALLGVAGVLVVLAAVIKVFGKVTSGKMGDAVKIAAGAAVFAVFLFDPTLITTVVNMFSTLVSAAIESFGDVVDKSGK
jgi:uncharacterized membrane protein